MAVIDIGAGATNRGNYLAISSWTNLDQSNAANLSGVLDVFEAWAQTSITSLKIGVFSGSGFAYTSRDSEVLGAVTSGSKQTFTGKNCDVVAGDFIAIYATDGNIELDTTGGPFYRTSGDKFGAGLTTFTGGPETYTMSLYATGTGTTTGIPIFMNQYRQRWN